MSAIKSSARRVPPWGNANSAEWNVSELRIKSQSLESVLQLVERRLAEYEKKHSPQLERGSKASATGPKAGRLAACPRRGSTTPGQASHPPPTPVRRERVRDRMVDVGHVGTAISHGALC